MMAGASIRDLFAGKVPVGSEVSLKGWVRTRRDSKGFSFLELYDGSCFASLQCVVDAGTPGYDGITNFTTGSCRGPGMRRYCCRVIVGLNFHHQVPLVVKLDHSGIVMENGE